MKHEEIKQQIFSLYDGPLTEKERVLLESHLSKCPECRQAIAEWKTVSETLFSRPAFSEAAEDKLVSKVMARLEPVSQKNSASSRENALRWLFPLFGSAIAAGWVFFSVLPNTIDFSNSATIETAFSSDASYGSTAESGVMLASYSSPSYEITP